MRKINIFFTGLFILSAVNCYNYGLVEKLEKPGGAKLYAFVTSASTLGDMSGLANGGCTGGGIAQADCACTDLAKANSLLTSTNGKFVSWLTDTSVFLDMQCHFGGITGQIGCNYNGNPQWYNTNEELLTPNGYANLFGGGLAASLKYTEKRTISLATQVMTGTSASGANAGGVSCVNWTSATASGEYGTVGGGGTTWTDNGSAFCSAGTPVYCFAVPD